MDDIQAIIKRLIDSCPYKNEGQIAKAIGETAANFSNKKKTGTTINALLLLGVKHGLRPEWLRTGNGEKILRSPASTEDVEKWKNKYIEYFEKFDQVREELAHYKILAESLKEQVDRLTAPPTTAEQSAASYAKGKT